MCVHKNPRNQVLQPRRYPFAARMGALGLGVAPADLVFDDQKVVNPALVYLTYSLRQNGRAVKATGEGQPKE